MVHGIDGHAGMGLGTEVPNPSPCPSPSPNALTSYNSPSKDSAWSKSDQPDNRYNGRREEFVELETVVMALSTGPVTYSDRVG